MMSPEPTPSRAGTLAQLGDAEWAQMIESAGPASLIVFAQSRIGPGVRSALSAEDVVQDAMMYAWRRRDTLEWQGLRAFRSWLLTVIEHRIRDAVESAGALKRGGGRATVPLAPWCGSIGEDRTPPPWLAQSTTPSRVATVREQAEVIRACLDALNEELRDVVRLRLVEQQSLDSIASQLGLTLSTVRHRLRKGAEEYQHRLAATPWGRASSGSALH